MELGIITMESGITWYDVLGVLPGAEARKIRQKCDSKAALLRPELTSGAPPDVLPAVTRAQELLDAAREVLGDPESRKRYDEAAGLRRSGGDLGQPGTASNRPGWRQPARASPVSWAGTRQAACRR
jgi:curved DNA-binding protein CbpA